jgi:MFS family permease
MGAAIFLVVATFLHQPLIGVLAVGLSAFCNDLVMPTAWGSVMDVAGGYSGTLSGTMNMMGNLGGAVYGPAAGFVLSHTDHNWNAVLFMGAVVYLAGFFMWMVIDPVTPIDRDPVHA